ncbi:MAG: hypothetical protein IKT32_08370, partial [Clostridia bacterium]|nr:hypothetical protein [Clostridia bacterium]
VVLQPILRYTANNIELKPKEDSVTIGVYQKYFPIFMLNGSLYYDGQEYSNVSCIYTSNNENVVINGKYIYLTKPGTANIKVEYDLGFIKGTTNFEITALPICNVHFFGYGGTHLEYDLQLNDIICDGENWQKPLNYYQTQNEKYYLLTGKNRELKELFRVNKTTFLPVFDIEHCLNSSELFLRIYAYSKEDVLASDLPESIEIKIGEKFNGIFFSRYGNYAMNDIKMSSIYCYDDKEKVFDENGYAVREGSCYIYCQLYSDTLTTYSEIFKIKIVVKQS